MMHLPTLISSSLGWLAYEFARLQPFIPTYSHLIVSALFPIYAGAHSSLSRPSSAAKPKKSRGKNGKNNDEEPFRMEGLTPTDAVIFPLMAGTTLAGLYFLIKWLQDATILNKILNWYFATFSVLSVARLVSDGLDVFHSLIFPHAYVDAGILFHADPRSKRAVPANGDVTKVRNSPLPGILSRLPLPQFIANIFWTAHLLPNRRLKFDGFVRGIGKFGFDLGIHGIEGLVIGLSTVLYYNFVDKPWYLTNLMAFGFAYGSLQILSPTTFWTGTLILGGLFFYDIYFVFFTPMMVTVAKSLDIPIKLLFPRPADQAADPASKAMSMLGLGDVVLPGILIGLALRFDLYMYYLKKQTKGPRIAQSETASKEDVINTGLPGEEDVINTESPGEDGLMRPSDDTTNTGETAHTSNAQDIISKASYTSVAEGWGDRFWTISPFYGSRTSYTPRGVFPKPYFYASIFGYVTGMVATLAAMQVSNHPQPALLYLVPTVLSSLWGTAFVRGEFSQMWTFSDAADEEQETDKTSKDKKTLKSKDGQDAPKSESGFASIFSWKRVDERAQRLEAASSIDKHENAEKAADESAIDASVTADHDRTFVSFSITLPPSASKKDDTSSSTGNATGPQEESGEKAKTDKEIPRWSITSTVGESEGHAGKRQRLG